MTSESGSQAVRGRPVAGAIMGLIFGIFLTASLLQMGMFALDSNMVVIVPIVLLIAGGAWGYLAPLRMLRR